MPITKQIPSLRDRTPNKEELFSALTSIATVLAREGDFERKIDLILDIIGTSVNVELLSLFTLDESGETFTLRNKWHSPLLTQQVSEDTDRPLGRWKTLLATGESISGNMQTLPDEIRKSFSSRNISSGIISPLIVQDDLLGFLEIASQSSGQKWDSYSMNFVKGAASVLAVALFSQRVSKKFQTTTNELAELRLMRESITREVEEIHKWKNHLFSSFTHQFQTPLYTLLGFSATLLENEELDEDKEIRKTCLQHIYDQSTRLEKLVGELMYASELQAREIQPTYQIVNLKSVLDELAGIFRMRCAKESVDFYYEVPDSDMTIECDLSQIHQLFFNLLERGLNSLSERQWLGLRAYVAQEYVTVTVSDNGQVISPERLERIFEPFYSISHSSSNGFHASLGLSIAKDIVDLHRGFITVESKTGEGTVFTVVLPRYQSKPRS